MGFYRDRVLPRLFDATLSGEAAVPYRRQACAGLSGRVLELGFGSGLNLPVLPPGVSEVLAVEPSDLAWERAADRIAAAHAPVRQVGLDAASAMAELPDGSVDAVLTTWTLCSVPDASRVLVEARRVLAPGGRLHLAEHGLAPDPGTARWQARLDGMQQGMMGGCHLTRAVVPLVTAAGFDTAGLTSAYATELGLSKPWMWFTVGSAPVGA